MDRFRDFFDNALLRARPAPPGQAGAAAPEPTFGLPPPDAGLFQVPPLIPGLGMMGGLPNLSTAPFQAANRYAQMARAGPGLRDIAAGPGLTVAGGPSMRQIAGETSGGASAVAAPGSSPTTAVPAHTGPAPTGTRDTVLRWLPQVQQVASKYDIPPELVLAIMHNESGGDPKAQSPYNPGQGHAKGLLQVMPFHFAPGEDPFDVATNLERGVKFMAGMYHKYGRDPDKTMAAYFGGPGAIDSAGNIRTGLSDVNISVGNYITKKFRPAYAAYQQYMQARSAPGLSQSAPQAANGAADLADLWAWLGGTRTPITGRFGAQDGPYPGTGHRGMDIGTPAGMRLTSPIEGVVIAAGDAGGGYGNQVRIQTTYGSVLLGHLGSVAVQPGQRVTPGTVLGATGNTGKSTGPHLHFELRDQADNAIDPARYYRW